VVRSSRFSRSRQRRNNARRRETNALNKYAAVSAPLQLMPKLRKTRIEKSSATDRQVKLVQSSFSDWPHIHYLLTICVPALLWSILIGLMAYGCFVKGTPDACGYPEELARPAFELGTPDLQKPLIFDSNKMLTALLISFIAMFPLSLASCLTSLPVYLGAFYVGKRCNIQRNVVGVIFWMIAWIIALLPLPAFLLMDGVDSRSGVSLTGMFAGMGGVCGTIYCVLAFRCRGVAADEAIR